MHQLIKPPFARKHTKCPTVATSHLLRVFRRRKCTGLALLDNEQVQNSNLCVARVPILKNRVAGMQDSGTRANPAQLLSAFQNVNRPLDHRSYTVARMNMLRRIATRLDQHADGNHFSAVITAERCCQQGLRTVSRRFGHAGNLRHDQRRTYGKRHQRGQQSTTKVIFHVSPLHFHGPGGVPRLISGYAFEIRLQYDFRTSFSNPTRSLTNRDSS